MKNSSVCKSRLAITHGAATQGSRPLQVFHGFKIEQSLKVVLLSGTMGVLGVLSAHAGTSSIPAGARIDKTIPAGPVVAQAVDECLAWDIACLLARPVGTVTGGPSAGPGNRGNDGRNDEGTVTGGPAAG